MFISSITFPSLVTFHSIKDGVYLKQNSYWYFSKVIQKNTFQKSVILFKYLSTLTRSSVHMSIGIRNCLNMYFHILMLDEYYLFVVDGSLIVNSMLIFLFLVDEFILWLKQKKWKAVYC